MPFRASHRLFQRGEIGLPQNLRRPTVKGLLYRVTNDPSWYHSKDDEPVELRTHHLCVNGRFHTCYTLKVWRGQLPGRCEWGDLHSEPVPIGGVYCRRDRAEKIRPCDGSCRREFDLEAFARESMVYEDEHEPGSSDDVIRSLRAESPSLLARIFLAELQGDGDGDAWEACTGSAHFRYEITEHGMPGGFLYDAEPCGGCEPHEIIIPPTVTRFLRREGMLSV